MPKIQLEEERVEELKQKIENSKEIFKIAYERFEAKDMRLIWSGGKDSTLTLWTCRQFCKENNLPMPKAFTIDEGDAFEEIDEFLKKHSKGWSVELDWGRNDDVLKAAGYNIIFFFRISLKIVHLPAILFYTINNLKISFPIEISGLVRLLYFVSELANCFTITALLWIAVQREKGSTLEVFYWL
ncbi:unnamed protein product [marine sediment metagenome]|uniref:Phosphoadenosine phosphosulphate reductase domain-containing protein n=1 Tax=marine sediment metagenome TaxID=412755 RepID=X1NWB5_9ZZZZ